MLRILLIDDNPHDRMLAIHALEREFTQLQFQQVIQAEDLEQALSTGEFDLVITDYQLRWSDGLVVLEEIKSHYPEKPIVMFTNSGSEEIAVAAMKSGLDDYVIKSPNSYMRLPSAVHLALERAETRCKVAKLEKRLQTLLNQLEVGVYRITAEGDLLEGNTAFLNLLGLNQLKEIPTTHTLESYFSAADYAELLKKLQQNGNLREREVTLKRVDGSVIWVRISKTISNFNGLIIIDGIIEDITARKLAEKALQESEVRFRRLFESNIIGILFWKLDGTVTDANNAYLQLLGYSREEMLTGKLNWIEVTAPGSHEVDQQIIQELKEFGVATPREKYYMHRAGYRVPVLVGCVLREGSQSDGLAFVLDLTERKQAEQEREKLLEREKAARAEAEAANRVKDEFLAILSHELRSPLNPILGWSKVLTSHRLDEAKRNEALGIIERNAKLQAQLIEDLLDISHILRGKLHLNVSSVDLQTTILAALETVRLAAEVKGIQLHTVFAQHVGLVLGDPTRLQQIVWNLLSNAVKFTPVNGRVEIKLNQVETQAQIQVIDTGQGISPEFLPYIFDYFRQEDSKTTRKFGGLGLGLAIVKHLVEMHGGTVWVDSQGTGKGTSFTVRLPLIKTPSQIQQETEEITNNLELIGLKILVVDDEIDSRQLVSFVLQDVGAEVITATSALEAIPALINHKPNALILDIGMPNIDGYMLLQQIRTLPPEQGGNVPAIALTAYAGELNKQQALAAGFHTHLSKPVEPNELVSLIANLISSKIVN
ncbi:MAG TPA: response regulator [Nostocaceae cyanobacterium]|nr:response regulator [Nostocaceae cyanobacterium]